MLLLYLLSTVVRLFLYRVLHNPRIEVTCALPRRGLPRLKLILGGALFSLTAAVTSSRA